MSAKQIWSYTSYSWIFVILCACFALVQSERLSNEYRIDDPYEDARLPLESRIRNRGYPVEIHTVNTTDGYILTLYRVAHRPNEKNSGNRSVVLLCHEKWRVENGVEPLNSLLILNMFLRLKFAHGLGKYSMVVHDDCMGASPTFFWLYEKYSLGYYLVDRGFDVWTMCARGIHCAHQKKHVKYDWDMDKKYWDFSMHHIGVYDLTAHIDHVLNHTGQEKLSLVGHSAGNTVFFIMLADRPEYNDKVKMAVAYAPSVILKNVDYPLVEFVAAMVKVFKGIYKMLGLVEFVPNADNFRPLLHTACADPEYFAVCIHVLSVIGSHMSVLVNHGEVMPYVVQDAGVRVSSKQIFHYLECIDDGVFRKYDYGPKKNLRMYGQATAPKYNMSQIVVPTAFFYANGDSICTEEDVKDSMDLIPNVVLEYRVPFRKFTHTDFIFAREAAQWVHEPTYRMFKDYDDGILPPKRKSRLANPIIVNNDL